MIYLIVYDRTNMSVRSVDRWPETDRAAANRHRLERELEALTTGDDLEVLILEADDDADLRQNHASYFASTDALLAVLEQSEED